MTIKKLSALILAGLFSTTLNAAEDESVKRQGFVSLEGGSTFKTLKAERPGDIEYLHSGIYAITEENINNRPVYGKLGASMLMLKKPRFLTANLEMAIGLRSTGKFSYFGGLGFIFSETIECIRCTAAEDDSDNRGSFGIFPEAGFRYDINKTYRVGAYARQYNYISCPVDSFYIFGLSLAMTTD